MVDATAQVSDLFRRYGELQVENEALRADAKRLDWLEAHLDEMTVIRDLSRGKSVGLDSCSEETGCQFSVESSTVREAIDAAMGEKEP